MNNYSFKKKIAVWVPVIAAIIAISTTVGLTNWLVMPWAAKSRYEAEIDHDKLEAKTKQTYETKETANNIRALMSQRIKQNEKAAQDRDDDIKQIRLWMWELVKNKREKANGP